MAGNPPVWKKRAGALSVSVWSNKAKEGPDYPTITMERGYKDNEDNWKSTQTLRQSDLAQAELLLFEARRYCAFEFGKKEA